MSQLNYKTLPFFCFLLFFIGISPSIALAQESSGSTEINGDIVEYSVDGSKILAEGNVVILHNDTILKCDKLEFFRDSMTAHANGNVRLLTKTGQLSGEALTFNFESMTGTFNNSRIVARPLYGTGKEVSKVSDDLILIEKGYMTTCDYDKPHFRMESKKIDIYPTDKMVAKHVKIKVGDVPIMYLPRLTQSLKDKKPRVIITPGFDKKWGMFVLTQWMYNINENFKGTIHVDAREKKDIASGVDLEYKTAKYGKGLIRTYYMNERDLKAKRFYRPRPSPTIEKERFKVEWRHKWDIDEDTKAILQFYRVSDGTILKDYFEREFKKEGIPSTYFLLTRKMLGGNMSFRTDARVNRFTSAVERLPEIQYNYSSKEIAETGVYFSNTTVYSNLTKKSEAPSEVRQNTMRLDTNSQVSYPFKLAFIELNPYIGGRQTYYTKTKDPTKYNSIRGIFRTGASLSTKIFRIFDTKIDKWGVEVNRLRHIITPSISYNFQHEPTVRSSTLDTFDGIDTLGAEHNMTFSLENKLQTKRNDETIDLVRATIKSPFNLNMTGGQERIFGNITSEVDFTPFKGLNLYFDSIYDTRRDHLNTFNFDLYINDDDNNWALSLGKRWNRDADDQLTVHLRYTFSPKWSIEFYERFDLERGLQKEQQIILSRDLHCWNLNIMFNETRGKGDEILFVMKLKAFPELGFDFGTSFNKRKIGSQKP